MCVGQSVRKTYKWCRMHVDQAKRNDRRKREAGKRKQRKRKYKESEQRLTEE